MASPKFNRERAVRILVDAAALGDRTACEQHKISEKTLRRYRARLGAVPELSAAVQEKVKQDDLEWGAQRRAFLGEAIRKLRDLVGAATVDHIHEVTGAIKIIGELQQTSEHLGLDGGSGDDQPSRKAEEAPGEERPSTH